MNNKQAKFKLGTADTLLVAVGTLAVDYICTSKMEIVEVQPGSKKLVSSLEELEEKIKRYGIKKGNFYPGSSLGNFVNQVQMLTFIDPSYAPSHLATSLALNDPLTKVLIKSLDDKHIQYEITEFTDEDATNPISLLIESRGYTKVISYKDKRIPAINVNGPKEGQAGLVIIGAASGHTVESKQNALNYALKHNLPIGVITTEGEINALTKNKAFKKITDEILKNASFLACNEDELRGVLLAEKPSMSLSRDRVKLALQLREVYNNPNLDILLSYGAGGSLALVNDTVVIQKIPDTERSKIVSTGGAGDALAGAFVQGVRMKGMDAEGVRWALPRANKAAQNVLKYPDPRTGHLTAEDFLKEPSSEFETEVINL